MVQVANSLVGKEHATGLDMPLSMKAEDMYEIAKEEIRKANTGRGVLLMVDMGSLVNFGSLISEEMGIIVKTIDMTSTPIVIEACRKAVLGRELNEIYSACLSSLGRPLEKKPLHQEDRSDLIITACFTGEGASERLRKIVEAQIDGVPNIEVRSLNILNKREFVKNLDALRSEHRILAVVSTIDMVIERYPLIPAVDLLAGQGLERLGTIVAHEMAYRQIGMSMKNHLRTVDGEDAIEGALDALSEIEENLDVHIEHDVKTGILLHMGFMLDRIKSGEQIRSFENIEAYKSRYSGPFRIVQEGLVHLESKFHIKIDEHEVAYITRMIMENDNISV
jgi:transcriptional regulatory protein LevR